MINPPRIWLEYRPVRIGWVVAERDLTEIATAACQNACLWGGRFNPIIPMYDRNIADKLINVFRVDVLLAVIPTAETKTFIDSYPHLHLHLWADGIFHQRRCLFLDLRHAVRRAAQRTTIRGWEGSEFAKPVWTPTDPLAPLFAILFGRYPEVSQCGVDYGSIIRSSLKVVEPVIEESKDLPIDLLDHVTPLNFTGFGLRSHRMHSGWLRPGIVLGSAANCDDLLLLWNLRAAGASACLYDVSQQGRMKQFVEAFINRAKDYLTEEPKYVNFWSRAPDWPPPSWSIDLDTGSLYPVLCRAVDWDSLDFRPNRPRFSTLYRDVVPSYVEDEKGAVASFALPDRPFDDDDRQALYQQFVVSVDAKQYGSGLEERTFVTPFTPKLNEFYRRNFCVGSEGARAEPGGLGHGAIGIITRLSNQRIEIRAISVYEWIKNFFDILGITVERSEPGLRCARLIRQLGGLHGCRVLKVRGARSLIRKYGPDQSFTQGAAEKHIGNFDEATGQMRFSDFEDLYIQPRTKAHLTPGEVLEYMTTHGVFRVGLELKCPNCELSSWVQLDDIKTISVCAYCGYQFSVTSQLRDRDWRYRRSGLFGRNDNQLGGIPVTLAIEQLEASLFDRLLMYSTSLNLRSTGALIEKCEVDFLAVVAGADSFQEAPTQILFGEAKTGMQFNADDVRKLGKLADAVPRDVADVFIMFAKTEPFTITEVRAAQTLNSQPRRRVILWSVDELEPNNVYERSKDRLGQSGDSTSLAGMAQVTHDLWFANTSPL